MQIAYMMGTSTSNALEAVYGKPGKQNGELRPSSEGGDSVSISSEALLLSEELQRMNQEKRDRLALENLDDDDWEALLRSGASGKRTAFAGSEQNGALGLRTDASAVFSGDVNADTEEGGPESGSSGAAGGGSFGGNDASRISDLEAKLEKLHVKIKEIHESALPEETKEGMIAGVQAEIDAVSGELSRLKSDLAKEAAGRTK